MTENSTAKATRRKSSSKAHHWPPSPSYIEMNQIDIYRQAIQRTFAELYSSS
jgi:hypothetical protein